MALGTTALLTILDSLAKGYQILAAAVGASGADAGTVAKGAANNLATLIAQADEDVAADLIGPFRARADEVVAPTVGLGALWGRGLARALDGHYGSTGGLNKALAAAGARVHPDLRKLGIPIDAANAFDPNVETLGSFAVSGSGAGVYTPGSVVNRSLYGKANVVIHATTSIPTGLTATLTLTKIDGSSETKAATFSGGSPSGTEVAIGTPGTDMYVACTAVTISGGAAAEAFSVLTQVERALTLYTHFTGGHDHGFGSDENSRRRRAHLYRRHGAGDGHAADLPDAHVGRAR